MTDDAAAALLTPEERRTLACAVDTLVPASADGRFPGAGELGVAEWIEARLADEPPMRAALSAGVQALESLTTEVNALGGRAGECVEEASRFRALDVSGRRAVLERLAATQPPLFGVLLFYTYAGYYCQPRVVAALGMEARPPYPQGYVVEESDLDSLLAPVRARARP